MSTPRIRERPVRRLTDEAKDLLGAYAKKTMVSLGDKATERLGQTAHGLVEKAKNQEETGPGVKAAIRGVEALNEGKGPVRAALGAGVTGLKEKVKQVRGGGGGKKQLKLTNIVETVEVGVPRRLAYDQWTQFKDFPTFMKKVEQTEQASDEKINWKAQVWWSHRTWESTIVEQVPDDRIVWRSKGAKGHVDGAVSFAELAPNLTHISLVMEYHPQGFFERTGNLWRAQGRRARLELKHFQRHLMTSAILKADEIEGWRGEIRDGKVVRSHEDALKQEQRAGGERPEKERSHAEKRPENEPQRPRRRPAEEEERTQRPARRVERPQQRPGRRRPGAEAEERVTGGRPPSKRGLPPA